MAKRREGSPSAVRKGGLSPNAPLTFHIEGGDGISGPQLAQLITANQAALGGMRREYRNTPLERYCRHENLRYLVDCDTITISFSPTSRGEGDLTEDFGSQILRDLARLVDDVFAGVVACHGQGRRLATVLGETCDAPLGVPEKLANYDQTARRIERLTSTLGKGGATGLIFSGPGKAAPRVLDADVMQLPPQVQKAGEQGDRQELRGRIQRPTHRGDLASRHALEVVPPGKSTGITVYFPQDRRAEVFAAWGKTATVGATLIVEDRVRQLVLESMIVDGASG